MPRVIIPNVEIVVCDVKATAQAWRRQKTLTATTAAARHAAMPQIITAVHAEEQTGALPTNRFWAAIFERVTAVADPAAPPPAPAAAAAPAAPVPN